MFGVTTALRRCLTQSVALAASAVLIASCSDATTATSPMAELDLSALSSAPTPDTVTITRTTQWRATSARKAGERTTSSRQVLGVQGYRRGAKLPSIRKLRDTVQDVIDAGLYSNLSIPASLNTLADGGQHWVRQLPYDATSNSVLVAEGDGASPATTLRLMVDGRVSTTVRRTYRRGAHSWDLLRQDVSTADGSFHELTIVHHSGAVPYHQVAPVGPIRIGATTRARSVASVLTPVLGATDFDPCMGDNFGAPSACADLKTAMDDAHTEYDFAVIAGAVACEPDPLAIACPVALAYVYFKGNQYVKAGTAYPKCIDDYHQTCGCDSETRIGRGTVVRGNVARGVPGGPVVLGPVPPSTGGKPLDVSESCLNFIPDPGSTDGSGSGSGSGTGESGSGTETCWWLLAVDSNGDVLWYELIGCEIDE